MLTFQVCLSRNTIPIIIRDKEIILLEGLRPSSGSILAEITG